MKYKKQELGCKCKGNRLKCETYRRGNQGENMFIINNLLT